MLNKFFKKDLALRILERAEEQEDVRELARWISKEIGKEFALDKSVICYAAGETVISESWSTKRGETIDLVPRPERRGDKGFFLGNTLLEGALFLDNLHDARIAAKYGLSDVNKAPHSVAILPLNTSQGHGYIELGCAKPSSKWSKIKIDELWFLARLIGLVISNKINGASYKAVENIEEYERLLKGGNYIIIKMDDQFGVTKVYGNPQKMIGFTEEELIKEGPNIWNKIVGKDELRTIKKKILEKIRTSKECSEEFSVKNKRTGEMKRIVGRIVPIVAEDGSIRGWDAIGLDITDAYLAKRELIAEKERIEALYSVVSAVRDNLDPYMVAYRGLSAVIKSTKSEGGLVCFYDSYEDKIELVAAQGLSEEYVLEVNKRVGGRSLARHAIESGETINVENIQEDDRALKELAAREGLYSTLVVPLKAYDKVLGCLVVFRKSKKIYTEEDEELTVIACQQVSVAVEKAARYRSEKQQRGYFAALYKLSHELSHYSTTKEIAHAAFQIIQQHFSCKRIWLGVMNTNGTHIEGIAGIGPGVRQNVINLQIELDLEHNFLDKALKTKKPVIMKPTDPRVCSALEKVLERLNVGTLVILPLVSVGQVVGVLVIEPHISEGEITENKLAFMGRMASEVGAVILANRYQTRIADADKMRMAGMFASGVAHNFNNMLQAILGQASLLELKASKEDDKTLRAINIIKSAAGRGADLVKQLLNFAVVKSDHERKKATIERLLGGYSELYKSIVGSGVKLEIDFTEVKDEKVLIDPAAFHHAMTNILINAKEAMEMSTERKVTIKATKVRLLSSEIDPELPPGEYIRIDVTDTGVGMSEEAKDRCFEPFFTTKNVDVVTGIGIGGSGLGLSTAYSLIRRQDGLITVSSHEAVGTTFSIYLPTLTPIRDTQFEVYRERTALIGMLYGMQSLTVETVLHEMGYKCEHARSLAKLFDVIQGEKQFGLIVVDYDRLRSGLSKLVNLVKSSGSKSNIVLLADNPSAINKVFTAENVVIEAKPLGAWRMKQIVEDIVGSNEGQDAGEKSVV